MRTADHADVEHFGRDAGDDAQAGTGHARAAAAERADVDTYVHLPQAGLFEGVTVAGGRG